MTNPPSIRPVTRDGVEIPGVVVDGREDGQARVMPTGGGGANLTVLPALGTLPAVITVDRDEALALAAGLISAVKGEAFLRALTHAMQEAA